METGWRRVRKGEVFHVGQLVKFFHDDIVHKILKLEEHGPIKVEHQRNKNKYVMWPTQIWSVEDGTA